MLKDLCILTYDFLTRISLTFSIFFHPSNKQYNIPFFSDIDLFSMNTNSKSQIDSVTQTVSESADKVKEKTLDTADNFRYRLEQNLPYITVLLLIIIFLTIYFWDYLFITIDSGEAGVLYKRFGGGTVTEYVYPEGFRIVAPWDKMHIYNVRIQTVLHDFRVLTNKGLPITLTLAIRFRPEYEMVGLLHKNVGPDYVNTIIIPQIESVLRKQIGQYNPEEIYVNREGFLDKIILQALEEAGQKYVIVDDVIIRTVQLPEQIRTAIDDKLVQEQLYKAYVFRLDKEKEEAKRKLIEAQGIRDYQDIISKTLNEQLIKWQGVQATLSLAESENAKIVIIGAGKDGLPIILGTER
jgi:regulator of protease activity HflC (stomatin/prohibitin superfamily)